jgi:hypothetical protein
VKAHACGVAAAAASAAASVALTPPLPPPSLLTPTSAAAAVALTPPPPPLTPTVLCTHQADRWASVAADALANDHTDMALMEGLVSLCVLSIVVVKYILLKYYSSVQYIYVHVFFYALLLLHIEQR